MGSDILKMAALPSCKGKRVARSVRRQKKGTLDTQAEEDCHTRSRSAPGNALRASVARVQPPPKSSGEGCGVGRKADKGGSVKPEAAVPAARTKAKARPAKDKVPSAAPLLPNKKDRKPKSAVAAKTTASSTAKNVQQRPNASPTCQATEADQRKPASKLVETGPAANQDGCQPGRLSPSGASMHRARSSSALKSQQRAVQQGSSFVATAPERPKLQRSALQRPSSAPAAGRPSTKQEAEECKTRIAKSMGILHACSQTQRRFSKAVVQHGGDFWRLVHHGDDTKISAYLQKHGRHVESMFPAQLKKLASCPASPSHLAEVERCMTDKEARLSALRGAPHGVGNGALKERSLINAYDPLYRASAPANDSHLDRTLLPLGEPSHRPQEDLDRTLLPLSDLLGEPQEDLVIAPTEHDRDMHTLAHDFADQEMMPPSPEMSQAFQVQSDHLLDHETLKIMPLCLKTKHIASSSSPRADNQWTRKWETD